MQEHYWVVLELELIAQAVCEVLVLLVVEPSLGARPLPLGFLKTSLPGAHPYLLLLLRLPGLPCQGVHRLFVVFPRKYTNLEA